MPLVGTPLEALSSGCEELGLEVPEQALHRLCLYVELLEKWNKAYNLTAIRSPAAMVTHHLLDSLAIGRYLEGSRILDVGTGPGFPGLPLAIIHPEASFWLLDSNGKKTRFIRQVLLELELNNAQVLQQRAETLVDINGFDMILSRAFASLADMLACTGHLLASSGSWLAMKGTFPTTELAELPSGLAQPVVHPIAVPGLEAERHIVILQRQDIVH